MIKIQNNQIYYHNPIKHQDILLEMIDVSSYQEIGLIVYDPSLYYNIDKSLHWKAEQTEMFYFSNKNHLYMISHFYSAISLDPEIRIYQLTGIDLASFKINHSLEGYSIDKNGVYLGYSKIVGLAPNTVQNASDIEAIPNKKFVGVEHQVLYIYP